MEGFNEGWASNDIDRTIIDEAVRCLKGQLGAGPQDDSGRLTLLACLRLIMSMKQDLRVHHLREKELQHLLKASRKINKELQELSLTDGLTNISNRRHFTRLLEQEWKRAVRKKSWLSVLMVDVDFFKRYNDTCGHAEGDECLRQVARGLSKIFKRPGDQVSRYGGEEFVILLPDTRLEGAFQIAEDARQAVANLKRYHPDSPVSPYVSISIGVASTKPTADYSPDLLLAVADRSLYVSKREGRNCVRGRAFEPAEVLSGPTEMHHLEKRATEAA